MSGHINGIAPYPIITGVVVTNKQSTDENANLLCRLKFPITVIVTITAIIIIILLIIEVMIIMINRFSSTLYFLSTTGIRFDSRSSSITSVIMVPNDHETNSVTEERRLKDVHHY